MEQEKRKRREQHGGGVERGLPGAPPHSSTHTKQPMGSFSGRCASLSLLLLNILHTIQPARVQVRPDSCGGVPTPQRVVDAHVHVFLRTYGTYPTVDEKRKRTKRGREKAALDARASHPVLSARSKNGQKDKKGKHKK